MDFTEDRVQQWALSRIFGLYKEWVSFCVTVHFESVCKVHSTQNAIKHEACTPSPYSLSASLTIMASCVHHLCRELCSGLSQHLTRSYTTCSHWAGQFTTFQVSELLWSVGSCYVELLFHCVSDSRRRAGSQSLLSWFFPVSSNEISTQITNPQTNPYLI